MLVKGVQKAVFGKYELMAPAIQSAMARVRIMAVFIDERDAQGQRSKFP